MRRGRCRNGADGVDGADVSDGDDGHDGADGEDGAHGDNNEDGADGEDGAGCISLSAVVHFLVGFVASLTFRSIELARAVPLSSQGESAVCSDVSPVPPYDGVSRWLMHWLDLSSVASSHGLFPCLYKVSQPCVVDDQACRGCSLVFTR